MPEITISKSTAARLHSLSRQYADTINGIIDRALDDLERTFSSSEVLSSGALGVVLINPDAPKNMRHSKIISATLDGENASTTWNALLRDILGLAIEKKLDPIQLCKKADIGINNVRGLKDELGENYEQFNGPNQLIKFVIQSRNADRLCKAYVVIARSIGITIEIEFELGGAGRATYSADRALLSVNSD